MRSCIAIVAAVLSAGAVCRADITVVEGYQTMKGQVWVFSNAGPVATQSFHPLPPDPVASWAPPQQEISAASGAASAHMVSNYSTSVEPHGLVLQADVSIDGTGAPTGEMCRFDWYNEFFLRFTTDAPRDYLVKAEIRRERDGWVTPIYPLNLSFTVYPQPAYFQLQLAAAPQMGGPPVIASYGPAILTLPAGMYAVSGSDISLEIESLDAPNDFTSSMSISITEVCYPDCDQGGALTIADFGCFQTKFVAGDPYADCNGSGQLTVADFGCFQTRFVAGCP